MTNFGYVRISPADVTDEDQTQLLEKCGIDIWYNEMVGVKEEHALVRKMLETMQEGDMLYIRDFTSIAKSNEVLLEIVEELENKNAHIVSIENGFDSSTGEGQIMLNMLKVLVEFHKKVGYELQREGIARAKDEGKYKGRVRIEIPNFKKYYKKYAEKKATKTAIAKMLGISRPTLDRLIKEYEEKMEKSDRK